MAYLELAENARLKTYRLLLDGSIIYEGTSLDKAIRILKKTSSQEKRNDAPQRAET